MWIALNSQEAIDDMLERFGGFHDGCLREPLLSTDTAVDERGSLSCPGGLDTTALIHFQSQSASLRAIELRCIGVSAFRLQPTAENCDSIISSATVTRDGDRCQLSVHFVGGPLTGPPNSWVWLPPDRAREPGLHVIAQSMDWRTLDHSFGTQLRYGPRIG